jgi:predicted patatin/cPLA2 family phospholipase
VEKREENPNQFLFYNLSDRIQFYFSPKEKTIEQILKELTNLQNNREARIEKTKKIIKSQRDNAKLTEIQEQDLVDSKNLKIIIGEVRELKEWLEK